MNNKNKLFVSEYIKDMNAAKAAIRAGYSQKTARSIGQRLLTKVDIKKAIEIELEEVRKANIAEAIEVEEFLTANTSYLERFCNPEELVISREIEAPELAMSAVLTGAELFLPLAGLINIEEEIARLEKELDKWTKEVKRVQGKLSNERFVSNAPDEVVEAERAKEKDYLEKQEAVKERIAQLRSI